MNLMEEVYRISLAVSKAQSEDQQTVILLRELTRVTEAAALEAVEKHEWDHNEKLKEQGGPEALAAKRLWEYVELLKRWQDAEKEHVVIKAKLEDELAKLKHKLPDLVRDALDMGQTNHFEATDENIDILIKRNL